VRSVSHRTVTSDLRGAVLCGIERCLIKSVRRRPVRSVSHRTVPSDLRGAVRGSERNRTRPIKDVPNQDLTGNLIALFDTCAT
jgi:hypothetical protein